MRVWSVLTGTRSRMVRALVVAASLALPAFGQPGTGAGAAWPEHPSARAFQEVWEAIRDHYILEDVDEAALWEAAIAGMVDALPDRWSYYLKPAFNVGSQGPAYGGVGMGLGGVQTRFEGSDHLTPYVTPRRIIVTDVSSGGPADLAGVRVGDIVLEVDGVDMRTTATYLEAIHAIRGAPDTSVSLVVERAGVPRPLTIEVVRELIPFEIADSTMLPGDVGYLALYTFSGTNTYIRFLRHLRDLEEAGATALIIDLRDNGGGYGAQGIRILEELLTPGDAWIDTRRGRTFVERTNTPRANDLPLVVLVNSRTLSMGELFAAVLQARGRALIVGERTAGKGLSYMELELVDGGYLALAHSEVTASDAKPIDGIGVKPDIWAPDTRRPSVITASGSGVQEGQHIQLLIDGAVVASTVADSGGFHLVGTTPEAIGPSVSTGFADPSTDMALQAALRAVTQLRDAVDTPD